MSVRPCHEEPDWPEAPDAGAGRVVFLLEASSGLEQRLLLDWIERKRPPGLDDAAIEQAPLPPARTRRRRRLDPRLEAVLACPDDPLLAPLRVIWRPPLVDGRRTVRLRHLLTLGDPRDPGRLSQEWLIRRHPDRCWIVAGEPAPLSELRGRWQQAMGGDAAATEGLADFVARQAALSLERAERRVRGQQYKVPRLVQEDVLGRPSFRSGITRIARSLGRSEASVMREAASNLREIAATHSPYVIDLAARLIRLLYTRGYSETLRYDRDQLRQLYALAQRHPVVFLPSHKSNLDHLVLQYALFENGLPPNHTAGGINMNFFPVGPLVRRSGVFFIRRTFKDQPIYKFTLRSYVDYLIEKRFSLEWYVEGGRSRSGKLLPPRLGLLTYVVDSFRRGRSDDVYLLPVSIAYDQIQDVGDYVAEQRGGRKQRESFKWFVNVIRKLHGGYGEIHIRFGEPLSLARTLGSGADAEPDGEIPLEVQKLAFEVSVRINRVTPITATSLVTLALLGRGDRALSVEAVQEALRNLLFYVEQRKLPTTGELGLDSADGVRRALEELLRSGVVTCFAEGPEAVYAIGPDQHLAAAYYRNTIIHFFVNGAIAELALLRAAEADVEHPAEEFWRTAMRLRDLLKFEFFFSEKDAFREEMRHEVAVHDREWELRLGQGDGEIVALLRRFRPYLAHRVLRPFLEAYRVVADTLERQEPDADFDAQAFLAACEARGKQYWLQRRSRSAESVSRVLYDTGVKLARNQGLLEPDGEERAAMRAAFAAEIRDHLRRVDAIDAMSAARVAGLLG